MALRASSGLYVLNSAQGTIRVQGRRGPRVVPGIPGPPRSLRVVSKTFKMSAPDQLTRLEVICPGGRYPIGGGMTVSPPPGTDGEGVYPHSYAICARGQIPQNPTPHKTVFILPGQTKSAIARCPSGQQLITGGFQRTNFASDGGNYVTESRAVGSRAWKVSGSAYIGSGTTGGGELTAIAYCARSKKRILTQVSSAPVPVAQGANASATTPNCPGRLRLTTTGFALDSRNAFYAGSSIDGGDKTTANAFGYFGPASLRAYAYCQPAK
jgi:hypothetical protein